MFMRKEVVIVFSLVAGCQQGYFGQNARGSRVTEAPITQAGELTLSDFYKMDADGNGEINQDDFFIFSSTSGYLVSV